MTAVTVLALHEAASVVLAKMGSNVVAKVVVVVLLSVLLGAGHTFAGCMQEFPAYPGSATQPFILPQIV